MKGSRITLTNNEIQDIIKKIKSLKKSILLKGTTRKITSQDRGFFNFYTINDSWFTIN